MSRPNASRDQLIYEKYAAGGITMREIAAAYGVTTQRISKIIARGVTEMKVPSIKFSPSASASPWGPVNASYPEAPSAQWTEP